MFGFFKRKAKIQLPSEPSTAYLELRNQVITLLEHIPDTNEHKERLLSKLASPFKKRPHRDLTPELTSFFKKIKRIVDNG